MPHIQKANPRSALEIENAAEAIIQRFQPHVLTQVTHFDIENFFEFYLEDDTEIEPVCTDLPVGMDGYTDSERMKCFISKSLWECSENQVLQRKLRSTMAHEVGHCYLHVQDARRNRQFQQIFKNDLGSRFEMYNPDDLRAYENPEWQAWRFASALLMPARCFRHAVNNNWSIRMLRDGFDVNRAYIEKRISELKIPKRVRSG